MSEVRFPVLQAQAIWGERRASGTDVMDRLHLGRLEGPIVDLQDVPGLGELVVAADGSVVIGARVRLADIAAHPRIQSGFPGLAAAVGGLATPQIRNVATLGGNLLQRTRCAWFRSPDFQCFKAGGSGCPAASVAHPWHAPLGEGPCVAPHPSTVAVALLAFDAQVDVAPRGTISLGALYGDGQRAAAEHSLTEEELLLAVRLPAPIPGARSAWFRVASRARAEWPLVEVVVHRWSGGARVAVGGLTPAPARLPSVEAALVAGTSVAEAVAAIPLGKGANPENRSKLVQLVHAVAIAVEAS